MEITPVAKTNQLSKISAVWCSRWEWISAKKKRLPLTRNESGPEFNRILICLLSARLTLCPASPPPRCGSEGVFAPVILSVAVIILVLREVEGRS